MKTIISSAITLITVALTLWVLISWANVLVHNGYGSDGEPADWNAFMIMTEAMK